MNRAKRKVIFSGTADLSALGAIGERLLLPRYGYSPKQVVHVEVWVEDGAQPSKGENQGADQPTGVE